MNPTTLMVIERSRRRHLVEFITDGATLEKRVLQKVAKRNWSFVFVAEERKRVFVLKLFNRRRRRGPLIKCPSVSCSTKQRYARDALFGMLWNDAPLSLSSTVGESVLLRKREQNDRAREEQPEKIEHAKDYDIFWCISCRDTKWLKASTRSQSDNDSE